jgi:hypothetical protein
MSNTLSAASSGTSALRLALRADFVLSLRPPSTYLQWMESEPTKYQLLEGQQNHWGLFRVLR